MVHRKPAPFRGYLRPLALAILSPKVGVDTRGPSSIQLRCLTVCGLQMTISYEVPTFLLPFAAVSSPIPQAIRANPAMCSPMSALLSAAACPQLWLKLFSEILFALLCHYAGAQPLGPLVESIISQDLGRFATYAKKAQAKA